jgi:hypothetical protein
LFFGLWLASKKFHHSAIQTKIELHFGGFFHQMKVRQPIGRQDSMQTVNRTSRRLDSFLHKAAQNFELWNIQDQKLKIKSYSGGCPFKGLSNGTTLMQIQSGRTVPLMLRCSLGTLGSRSLTHRQSLKFRDNISLGGRSPRISRRSAIYSIYKHS